MKDLLSKLDEIDNLVDPTPKEVKQLDEMASMNISMSGENANEVAQLVAIMQKGGAPEPKPVDMDMINPPMDKLKAIVGPKMLDKPDMDDLKPGIQDKPCPKCGKVHIGMSGCHDSIDNDDEPVEGWENEPDEEYKDHEYMTKDLSGGINREKNSYKAAQRGDNAMNVEEIANQKMKDLNALDLEQAVKIISGSARSMGIEVKE